MPQTQDRVSYSFGMKLNLGNYESADFHISYSTDVADGESVEKAFKRAVRFVESEAKKQKEEIENAG